MEVVQVVAVVIPAPALVPVPVVRVPALAAADNSETQDDFT